jgi:predicted nucleotidyltransferase
MYTQQELILKLNGIFERYPIKRAALFGSYSRGEQTNESDLDLLIEIDQTSELLDIIYVIWDEVEQNTTIKTDIMTFKALGRAPNVIRERILREMRYIYEV